LDENKETPSDVYLIIDDEPFLKINSSLHHTEKNKLFPGEDVSNALGINESVRSGWDVSFLSGYLDEGCHSISIGFLDNNFLFIKNFPNKICKEPKN